MSVVAETLGVSRSNLHDRLKGSTKPRRRYHKAQDAAVVPLITALAAARPTSTETVPTVCTLSIGCTTAPGAPV